MPRCRTSGHLSAWPLLSALQVPWRCPLPARYAASSGQAWTRSHVVTGGGVGGAAVRAVVAAGGRQGVGAAVIRVMPPAAAHVASCLPHVSCAPSACTHAHGGHGKKHMPWLRAETIILAYTWQALVASAWRSAHRHRLKEHIWVEVETPRHCVHEYRRSRVRGAHRPRWGCWRSATRKREVSLTADCCSKSNCLPL